ncbi:MAG TPA: hypothetical protein VHF58_05500, partial [Solirubrobacterales bacterium]|nr:hypothetical protein [Solirubrobacterales bacterium]
VFRIQLSKVLEQSVPDRGRLSLYPGAGLKRVPGGRRKDVERMTRGRQSMRGKLALGLISALVCALALVPASASAAGDCEYCVDIPGGDGSGQDPTANASGGSGGSSGDAPAPGDAGTDTATTPATTDTGGTVDTSEDADESGGGAAGGGGKGGDGDEKALSGKGGERQQNSLPPTENANPASTSTDSDDGGGFPVILVAIAVALAAGVAFLAWRSRRDGDGVGRPAETGQGA